MAAGLEGENHGSETRLYFVQRQGKKEIVIM
jgi:hypothetical protein